MDRRVSDPGSSQNNRAQFNTFSVNEEHKSNSHCVVCNQRVMTASFGIIFAKKFTCDICHNAVCDDCSKSKHFSASSSDQRICKNCQDDQIFAEGDIPNDPQELQQEIEKLKQELSQKTIQKEQEQARRAALQYEFEQLKEEYDNMSGMRREEVGRLQEYKDKLMQEKAVLLEKINGEQNWYVEQTSLNQELETQIKYLKVEVKKLEEKVLIEKDLSGQLQTLLKEANVKSGSAQEEIDELQKKLEQCNRRKMKLQEQYNNDVEQYQQEVQDLESLISNYNTRTSFTEESNEEPEYLKQLKQENQQLKSRLHELENDQLEQTQSLVEVLEKLKKQLQEEKLQNQRIRENDTAGIIAQIQIEQKKNQEYQQQINELDKEINQIRSYGLSLASIDHHLDEDEPLAARKCKCIII